MNKSELRIRIREERKELTKEEKKEFDYAIFYKLINSKEYVNAQHIFIYVSLKDEVDTYKIIEDSILRKKHIYVPKVISEEKIMKAVQINSISELELGYYGVYEPVNLEKAIGEKYIDLVIVPGMAFDYEGGRLGYGGGFYDKFLSRLNPKVPKIALAYEFQLISKVPTEKHDVKVDRIITN